MKIKPLFSSQFFSFLKVSFPKRKLAQQSFFPKFLLKKAQQEIVGLMVIVIILVFAVLFFLMLSSKTTELPSLKEVAEATSTLNIISKVNLCHETTLEEAVKLCSQNLNACNKNACELVKEESVKMLKLILKPKEAFTMNITKDDISILEFGNCKGDIIVTSRKIPMELSVIDLKLALCRE